jgi:hypothetical protein
MRSIASLFTILLCCLLLAACGDDDKKSSKPSGASGTATAAPAGDGPVPDAATIKKANAACKETTDKLANLEPLPSDVDPEKPGDKLKSFSEFLDRTDPDDKIERELAAKLRSIAPDGGGAYAELVTALDSIIEHETARNAAGIGGDLESYNKEFAAADGAYADLRAAAKKLKAPACTLGS